MDKTLIERVRQGGSATHANDRSILSKKDHACASGGGGLMSLHRRPSGPYTWGVCGMRSGAHEPIEPHLTATYTCPLPVSGPSTILTGQNGSWLGTKTGFGEELQHLLR